MRQTVANERQHPPSTPSMGCGAGSRHSILTVALVPRNPERNGRSELGFLDKDEVKGVKRKIVSELKLTGPHSVCVPLKNPELIRERVAAKRRWRQWRRRGRRRRRGKSRGRRRVSSGQGRRGRKRGIYIYARRQWRRRGRRGRSERGRQSSKDHSRL